MPDYDLNIRLVFMMGIFLTSSLFFLLFYFSFRRKASLLWLSLYCLSHPVKSLFKPWQNFINHDFIQAYQQHSVTQAFVVLGGFFLIGFILWELSIRRKEWWITLFGLFCVGAYFFLSDRFFNDFVSLLAISLSLYGVIKKLDGAVLLLAGIFGYTVFIYLGHADLLGFGYFIGIIFFIICMLILINQKVATARKARERARLRAVRLENQLLKTTIQPHFVFNSLAALQELIERDPRKASVFVERLAGEFKLINKASDKGLISIIEEIELCKMHLAIMEFRKNATFSFEVSGITGSEMVPPGIFHTLVENGITHGYSRKDKGVFSLTKTQDSQQDVYTFFNDSDVQPNDKFTHGTGFKYIEARLHEQYGENWTVDYNGNEKGWSVVITIQQQAYAK